MGSLIIKPVQRIMKYPLLLGELWQATPEDHPDYRPLQEALTTAKIINVNINEFKRRKDIGEVLFLLNYVCCTVLLKHLTSLFSPVFSSILSYEV